MIKLCHVARLPYAFYGIWHQYSANMSAWLDSDWNYFYLKSAKKSIFQQFESAPIFDPIFLAWWALWPYMIATHTDLSFNKYTSPMAVYSF